MELLNTIVSALLPIVFATALGWLAGARGMLPEDANRTLATFVVKFALPLSLFLAAASAKRTEILNPALVGTLLIGLLGSLAVAVFVSRRLLGHRLGEAGMQGLTGSFANMAYCGPPVLGAVAGAQGALCIVIGNLILAVLMFPAMLAMISRDEEGGAGGGLSGALADAVRQPLFFLPVLGLALALLEIPLPHLAVSMVDTVAKAAGGVALFTLGLILSGIRFEADRDVFVNVAIKNFLQPALMLGAGFAFGLTGGYLKAAFLLGVLPSATAVPTLALAHGTYAKDSAASVFASTVLSVATISIGIALAGLL